MSDNPMFLYAGDYESVDDAKADLEALKELHREHLVGTFGRSAVQLVSQHNGGARSGSPDPCRAFEGGIRLLREAPRKPESS
jgi:hypothetical protein